MVKIDISIAVLHGIAALLSPIPSHLSIMNLFSCKFHIDTALSLA